MTEPPQPSHRARRLARILATDSVAIINTNLRAQVGIPVERIER